MLIMVAILILWNELEQDREEKIKKHIVANYDLEHEEKCRDEALLLIYNLYHYFIPVFSS